MSSFVSICSTVLVDILPSGREFQSSITLMAKLFTLMAKKFCLINLLLRCLYSFLECPPVVVSENWKNFSGEISSIPFRILKTRLRSPLFRRNSSVGKFRSSSLCS